jgi:hypothetical protein
MYGKHAFTKGNPKIDTVLKTDSNLKKTDQCTSPETPMCDAYVYYFVTSNSQDGDNMLSTRPATLETIKDRGGDPVMESQMVVDHTQLDVEGFLVAAVSCDSHEINDLAAQIWYLEVRAAYAITKRSQTWMKWQNTC